MSTSVEPVEQVTQVYKDVSRTSVDQVAQVGSVDQVVQVAQVAQVAQEFDVARTSVTGKVNEINDGPMVDTIGPIKQQIADYSKCQSTCLSEYTNKFTDANSGTDITKHMCVRLQKGDILPDLINPDKDKCGWFNDNKESIVGVLKSGDMTLTNVSRIVSLSLGDKNNMKRDDITEQSNLAKTCINPKYIDGEYFKNVKVLHELDNFCIMNAHANDINKIKPVVKETETDSLVTKQSDNRSQKDDKIDNVVENCIIL